MTPQDIDAAAGRIAPHIRATPVLTLAAGELLDRPVTLKLEFLQRSGSFKARGAFNRMLAGRLPAAGVIAASGGNHGAAVACAAQQLGVAAEIFVPDIAAAAKCARIEAFGATLVKGGATYNDAYEASLRRQAQTGALAVSAYDHEDVVAGQGTLARELEAQAPELTHLLVAVGGGGLIGGIAGWYGGRVGLVGVEPEGCPTLHAALAAGRPVAVATGGLAADSLGARELGRLSFGLVVAHLEASVLVADAAIARARALLWERCRILVEPGGATALAALLAGAFVPPPDARVGVVLCGANTDLGEIHVDG